MAKTLIAFFSRAEENYVNGMLKRLPVGNTEIAAGMVRELTDGDLFKVILKFMIKELPEKEEK